MMQPTDQISSYTEQLYSPKSSQGGLYHMVMTSCVIKLCVAFLARPKSQIFSIPSLEQSKFEVLRSRCTIFLSWRQAMPSNKSLINLLSQFSLNCTALSNSLTSWSKYSMTMYTLSFSLDPATRVIFIMFGWSRLRRMAISRKEVIGKSAPSTNFNFFIARIRPLGIYNARQTTPYCPSWILFNLLQQFMSSHPYLRQHRLSFKELSIGQRAILCSTSSRVSSLTLFCVCSYQTSSLWSCMVWVYYIYNELPKPTIFKLQMIRRNKYLLVFSIIYWLVVIIGVALFSVSFQKVPIGSFGLRANFFSPDINPVYYTAGLYNAGVGFYFILFPRTKQCLIDNRVTVINKNLQKLSVTYTICSRINPNKIYELYQSSGYDYARTLTASANNIISAAFMSLPQEQSRVSLQNSLIATINSNSNKIALSLNSAVAVQGFFINEIEFPQEIETQYQASTALSDSYEQSYESTQLQYQKTRLQIQNVKSTIDLIKQQFIFAAEKAFSQSFTAAISTDLSNEHLSQAEMSAKLTMRRIWAYYNSTRMVFPA